MAHANLRSLRPRWQERLYEREALLGKLMLTFHRNLPIRVECKTESGVGVSGVRPELDEQIASAGIAAFNRSKLPPVMCNLGRLDLLSIRLVLLCAQYGSLSEAAPHANLSLTGASHRLAALEGRLGIKLFDRGRRGLRPTASGSTFLSYAQPLVDLACDLDRAVRIQAEKWPPGQL